MAAGPGSAQLREAVAAACRAPSLHNSQPWRWQMLDGRLQLRADPARSVPVADPLGRQMVISCGAALHHLQVAVTQFGLRAVVHRLPDPQDPMRLAVIAWEPVPSLRQAAVEDEIAALRRAIDRRRTDRRPFGPPGPDALGGLGDGLPEELAATLTVLEDDGPARVREAARCSAAARRYDPGYHAELFWWAGHSAGVQGIPGAALPLAGAVSVGRDFPLGTLPPAPGPDRAALGVLSTEADTRLDWLRGGEALSRVLLAATARGLATCPLTQLTEVAVSRRMVGDAAAANGGAPGYAQVVVRFGVGPAGPPPAPGRRPPDQVWEG